MTILIGAAADLGIRPEVPARPLRRPWLPSTAIPRLADDAVRPDVLGSLLDGSRSATTSPEMDARPYVTPRRPLTETPAAPQLLVVSLAPLTVEALTRRQPTRLPEDSEPRHISLAGVAATTCRRRPAMRRLRA